MRLFRLLPLLLASAALGDGFVLQRSALPAPMPAQCAVLAWRDGMQTLAIRTDLDAQPGDSAWVVPVPAKPELFEVRAGVVESARASFTPRLAHDPAGGLVGGAVVILLIALLLHVVVLDRSRVWSRAALVAVLAAILLLVIVPSLGRARSLSNGESVGVSVHDRRVIGSSEVAVVSSADAAALSEWLGRFGIPIPEDAKPVIADYCRQGWCFLAARLADAGGPGVVTPTPVGMRFPTPAPVYPMRLTGVGNRGARGPLDLELLVFGSGSASAPGMTVESSGPVEAVDEPGAFPISPATDAVRVSHRGVLRLVEGAAWATKLRGSFVPAAMAQDLTVSFGPGVAAGRAVFSEVSRRWRAAFAACVAFSACSILALPVSWRRMWTRRRAVAAGVLAILAAALTAGWAVRGMPVVTTKLTDALRFPHRIRSAWYQVVIASPPPANAEQARGMFETALREHVEAADMPAFGEGPGRYTIREVEGGLEFSWVNDFGQEWSDDSLKLPAR